MSTGFWTLFILAKVTMFAMNVPVWWVLNITSLRAQKKWSHPPVMLWCWKGYSHIANPGCLATFLDVYMGVSKNNGTPKSSILVGFPLFSPSILGVSPIFGNIHMGILMSQGQNVCSFRFESLNQIVGFHKNQQGLSIWSSIGWG